MSLDTPLRLVALAALAVMLVYAGWVLGKLDQRSCVTVPTAVGDVPWCAKGQPASGVAQ